MLAAMLSLGFRLTSDRDLYLRALAEMQSQDSADPLSFFQVAGELSCLPIFS